MKLFSLHCLFILLTIVLCKYLSLSLCPYYYCLFVILCCFPRWVLDHFLGFVWEVPLGGRNPIPPRHLGIYFLLLYIYVIHFIFKKSLPPLLLCHLFNFLRNLHSPLLSYTYICIYMYTIPRHLNKKDFIFPHT